MHWIPITLCITLNKRENCFFMFSAKVQSPKSFKFKSIVAYGSTNFSATFSAVILSPGLRL